MQKSVRRHIPYPDTPTFNNLYKEVLRNTDNTGRLVYANFDPSLDIPPTPEQIELLQSYKPVMPIIQFTGSEKLHGCLHADTLITTKEFGEISISSIIDDNINCSVLTFNHDKNVTEWGIIKNRIAIDDPSKEWYEVETDTGETLTLTGNHEIWIESKQTYITVEDLYKERDEDVHTILSCY